MKIAFMVHRSNFLKLYGPVIDAALKRGHSVETWIYVTPRPGKVYLRPSNEDLAKFGDRVKVVEFQDAHEVYARALDAKVNVIVSLHPKSYYVATDAPGIRFATLQYGIDTFVRSTVEELASSDDVFLYTSYWLDWAAKYYAEAQGIPSSEARAVLAPKTRFVGFPQMDIVGSSDKDSIRAKYGIKNGKHVVLLLPITLANKGGAWPRFFEATNRLSQISALFRGARTEGFEFAKKLWLWAVMGWNDRILASAIAKFAKANNAVLIVKGREKDPIRPWLAEVADIVTYDEEMYPATILELLSIADLCIQFYSMAALEATYCGVPSLTIDRPSPTAKFLEAPPLHHALWRRGEEGSAYHFPGVISWMTIPEAIRDLAKKKLNEFELNRDARIDYLRTYLSPYDTNSASDGVLDLIEETF